MISTVEKVLFLKSIDLFRALPSEELAQIAEIAEEQPLAAGDQVFAQGEPGDALYLIVGLAGPEPDVRAWEIRDAQVTERALEVT